MKSLVLGGTGFIGSWIVRELRLRGIVVNVLTRKPPAGDGEGINYLFGDCQNHDALSKAMAGCDAVFHAAAYYPLFSLDRDRQAAEALLELRTVLHAAVEAKIPRFVFTSSPMALIDDPAVLRRCTYHYIKRLLHDEVLRWVDRGLPGIVIIPGACFGPDDWKPTTGRVIVEVATSRLQFFLDGKMNAVDVRDVARGQIQAMIRGSVGSCYEMGNWNCTLSEFTSLVARIAHVPPPRIRLPYLPTKALAGCVEWIQFHAGARTPLLPQSGLDQIHYGTHLDSSLATDECGFATSPIERTLRETLDYFKARGLIPSPAQTDPLMNGGRPLARINHRMV